MANHNPSRNSAPAQKAPYHQNPYTAEGQERMIKRRNVTNLNDYSCARVGMAQGQGRYSETPEAYGTSALKTGVAGQAAEPANTICFAKVLLDAIDSGLLEFKDSDPTDSLNPECLLRSMGFAKNSIEELISVALTGRMAKAEANLVAIELGYLINSSTYKNGATIEERAINRETGMRLAERFAQTYFGVPGEVNALMSELVAFAEKDIMREKGYVIWERQACRSYRALPISVVYTQDGNRWRNETMDAAEADEKMVDDAVRAAKSKLNDLAVAAKLEQVLDRLSLIDKSGGRDATVSDIQWLMGIKDRILS
jgi:hypothetical protein